MLQLAPAPNALEVVHVVVPASTLKSPLMVNEVKFTAVEPLLVSVRLCALLVVPTD